MLAFEGDTGPYLLYAVVRIKNIFRKAAETGVLAGEGSSWKQGPIAVNAPAEKTLALALLRYPGVLQSVGTTLDLHRLCQYLFEVAGCFASFYDQCPVLNADDAAVRASRLRLCDLTRRVVEDGLGTLGITAPERM